MPVGTKKCLYCLQWYPEDSFGVALTTPTKIYRRQKCRDCYRSTKQILIRRNHQWLSAIKKERGCSMCGITNPLVLDFHHEKEEDKSFGLGTFRRSVGIVRIKEEVEKCEVLCANCHRIEHHRRHQKK
jgi:hypothetical protein